MIDEGISSDVWMSTPVPPDGQNETDEAKAKEKNAHITYAGETEVFERHIAQIQKCFSQQTFAFTRKNSLQSHSAAFEKDAFVFAKLPSHVCMQL